MFLGGFHGAMILLLDYWGNGETKKEDVQKCIDVSISMCEEKCVGP